MTVLLTGASSGIGLACLELLTSKGHETIVLGRNRPAVDFRGEFRQVDLSNESELLSAVSEISRSYAVQTLINNAGIGFFSKFEDIPVEKWQAVLALNLTAPFLLIRAILPGMRVRGEGTIINISSDADAHGFAGGAAYCASKHGLAGMTSSLNAELTGSNITVTNISPGRVDTCFNNKRPGDRPLSLSPEDVAHEVLHVMERKSRVRIENIRLSSRLE